MKIKFVSFTILLALAFLAAACMTQNVTNESGASTAVTTVSTDVGTPTEGVGGTVVIPETGPGNADIPDDLDEVMRVLRETGATVELGDAVE